MVLVACGTDDDEEVVDPTAPVEDTVATGEPEEVDEVTEIATAAVEDAATPDDADAAAEDASPVASPMMVDGATPAAGTDEATPAMAMDQATPVDAIATPAEEMIGEASPVAATPEIALEEATPIGELDMTAEEILGSPAASPMASPVASPVATPDATPEESGSTERSIPVVFFDLSRG